MRKVSYGLKWVMLILLSSTLIACSGGGTKKHTKSLEKDLYVRAQTYLKSGDVMRARDALYAMKNTHVQYSEAMILLKKKVEPRRIKELKAKKKEAKEARWQGRWQEAYDAYIHASELALGDSALEKSAVLMQTKVHQNLLNSLLKKRSAEDDSLKKTLAFYATAPKGLAKNDEVFQQHQQRIEDRIKNHSEYSIKQAESFLKEGYPEAAYAEMVSYARFNAKNDAHAKQLLVRIKKAIHEGVRLPGAKAARTRVTKRAPAKTKKPIVTSEMIESYIQKEEWIKAKQAADLFQKQGGDSAGYLALILKKRQALAQQAYELGRQAFLQEKLGSAVSHWQVAVHLMPENKEYNSSLGRATRLQKRLKTLKNK
ncbi:MAG: hypothetical protein Q9M28_03965 [Mariprofundaceae bacterium]|nr:hypothetical protein [Mariprofundaceae bacterium]